MSTIMSIITSIVVSAATSYITACFSRAQLLAEYKLMFSDHISKARYDTELEIFREISSNTIGTVNAAISYSKNRSPLTNTKEDLSAKIDGARKCLASNVAFIDKHIYDDLEDLIDAADSIATGNFVTRSELVKKREEVIDKMRSYFISLGK